jgi:hypothetical protein
VSQGVIVVSAVSRFNSSAAALQPVPPVPPVEPRPKPEDLFNALDTGSKGYLTQEDLQSAIVNISDEGVKLSAADSQARAKEIFSKIDANGDGKATLEEFKQAAPERPSGGPPPAGGPQDAKGGKPPGGGPRGGGAAKSEASYDPADTNKDGVVSELERMAYSAKHVSTAAQTTPKSYQNVNESVNESGVR